MAARVDGAIDVLDLNYSYTDLQVLRDVNFHVDAGKIVSLVGPSGCGKTTLLNIIAGVRKPTTGEVKVNGKISYMFQRDVVLPWFRVERNAELGLIFNGIQKEDRKSRVKALLQATGLEEFSRKYPHQLSGGLRRRLQMVTVIATNPEIILMDEPFIALDEHTKMEMHNVFLQVWNAAAPKPAVILVTHDISEAVSLSDEVYAMTKRPSTIGHLVKIDLPRPRDVFSIRANDSFTELYREIYEILSGEF